MRVPMRTKTIIASAGLFGASMLAGCLPGGPTGAPGLPGSDVTGSVTSPSTPDIPSDLCDVLGPTFPGCGTTMTGITTTGTSTGGMTLPDTTATG